MEIKLIATTGRAKGQAVDIRNAKFFIGRHDNCQLKPDIQGLAGIHALIEERENRLYLRDFGAEGGTGINDRVLHAREIEVFDSDLIQIGPMVLTLSVKPKGEGPHSGIAPRPGWLALPRRELTTGPSPTSRHGTGLLGPPTGPDAPAGSDPRTAEASVRPVPLGASVDQPRHEGLRHAVPLGDRRRPDPGPGPAVADFPAILTKSHGHRAIDCKMVDSVMSLAPRPTSRKRRP